MNAEIRALSVAMILAFGATALSSFGARAEEGAKPGAEGIKAGMLSCNVDSGWGFVFGSSRNINCTYDSGKGKIERYSGDISKFGVDIGYTGAGVIAWAVIAPTSDVGPGSLAGEYAGATGSAAVGVGVGANVLLGGFKNSIALQPVSIQGMTGVNVAGGIAALTLKAMN
jgi:hypothetical protein